MNFSTSKEKGNTGLGECNEPKFIAILFSYIKL